MRLVEFPTDTHEINGVTLQYVDQGLPDSQVAPLVLLHGFPLDAQMWAAQVQHFSRSRRVIAPNLRGFGSSGLTPTDAAAGVPMHAYASEVLALLDHLDVLQPVALAGFSMGGYIAWQFALRHPERLDRLIQIDTRAVADTETARQARLQMATSMDTAADTSATLAMLDKLIARQTLRLNPELVEHLRDMLLRQSPAAVAAAQRGMARRPDVTEQLGALACPTLLLCGAEDPISTPDEMQQIASALPYAHYQEIPSAGHMTPLENPAAVNDAISAFLASAANDPV